MQTTNLLRRTTFEPQVVSDRQTVAWIKNNSLCCWRLKIHHQNQYEKSKITTAMGMLCRNATTWHITTAKG